MPADIIYVTDTGMTLCGSCAKQAQDGVLMVTEISRMSVLDGEQHVIVPEGPLQVHNVVDSYPATELTMCWACTAMMAPR